MFVVDNYIVFHDLSPKACYLWASSSITTCLGYEPEEIVGTDAYKLIHVDDQPHVKIIHHEGLLNEMVGTQLVLRIKHKNGTYVPCMVLFSVCYDYLVSCYTVINKEVENVCKLSAYSAAMSSLVGSKKKEFERIRRHHGAFRANSWNPTILDPEPRACMLLNRFSRNLSVMYASPSCEMIFNVDPDDTIGKPFLLFVRSDDLGSFVEQVDLAKSSTIVTHMRFWFQSPSCQQEIPCEVMLFGAADGMIAILRRCKPFVRRHLLTAGPALECRMRTSSASLSFTSYTNTSSNIQGYIDSYICGCNNNIHFAECRCDGRQQSSSCGNDNNSYNNSTINGGGHNGGYKGGSPNNRHHSGPHPPSGPGDYYLQHVHSINNHLGKGVSAYSSTMINSPTDSTSSSYSSSASGSHLQGTRAYRAPLRGLAIGSINSIRNLDSEHNELRPLTSVNEDESFVVKSNMAMPEAYRMRKHFVYDAEIEDTELEARISGLYLDDHMDEESDEEDTDQGLEHIEMQIPSSATNNSIRAVWRVSS
ncbi:hypothetical protein EDD11_009720 [Mortierella claussenii]|nr:hypothetical protein EDD11_009720 [Mortierella claussenii]